MKYKSELIKDIVDTRGHEKSSLHYESECVESWINEAKGAYPKLTDYESEWLNYIAENPIGIFPYEALSDITEATVNNVVPYAFKSAILKGKTVSNLWKELSNVITVIQQQEGTTIQYDYSEQYVKVTFGEKQDNAATTVGINTTQQLQGNKTYYINTFVLDGSETTDKFLIRDNFNNVNLQTTVIKEYPVGQILSFTTEAPTSRLLFYYFANTRKYEAVNYGKPFYMPKRFIISDKLEDVVNQEFFEGMQSVKMPVLTISNEDGTKTNILTVNEEVTLHGIGEVKDELNLLTGELVQKTEKIIFDGSESWEVISSLEKDNTIFAQCYTYTRNNTNTISNILDYVSSLDALDKRGFRFNHFFQIRLNKDEISNITNNGVKEWVSKNNIIVVRVEEQTVKTVDLNVVDQYGNTLSKIKPIEGSMHLSTDGNPIKPTFTGEVPIEAITQNLSSFIKEE